MTVMTQDYYLLPLSYCRSWWSGMVTVWVMVTDEQWVLIMFLFTTFEIWMGMNTEHHGLLYRFDWTSTVIVMLLKLITIHSISKLHMHRPTSELQQAISHYKMIRAGHARLARRASDPPFVFLRTFAILDEATSALDRSNQEAMYSNLKRPVLCLVRREWRNDPIHNH